MKRNRRVRPEALAELHQAAEWYEEQRAGLGRDLLDEFERTLEEALTRLPTAKVVSMTPGGLAIRRFRLRRFSRYAIYVLEAVVPVVLAFEHSSRRPGFWRDRIE